jgi:serine/threonine-protein kinase
MQKDFRYGGPLRALLRKVAASVSRLQHPNIVQIYECDEKDGRPYFIMELLPGGSLASRINEGEMSIEEAVLLVRTLARTMEDVHRQEIIHGNLKPSKVLLAADGTPKIIGFIIDRQHHVPDPEERINMTMAAPAVMGTPRYMAPEQISGESKAIGPATDVYALGLIMYELLTGMLPFRAPTLWEMMAQVLREPPQPPHELRADLPSDLEKICLCCLEKQPARRYPSAAALADDLDCFLAGKPLRKPLVSDSPLDVPQPKPTVSESASDAPLRKQAVSEPLSSVWERIRDWLMGRPRK